MKKFFTIVFGMLLAIPLGYSQSTKFIFEDFDGGTISFLSNPSNKWKVDTNYYVTFPNGYLGEVPNLEGDSIVLTSDIHNMEDYDYVYFWFNQICKVSPQDICRIEYKIRGQNWQPVPGYTYVGTSNYMLLNGFNAGSYTDWKGNDSLALPDNSWWKQEIFDVSGIMSKDPEAQFRFVLKHGSTPGTNISYGWLLDAVKIIGSTYPIDCMTADCFNANSVALSSLDSPIAGTTTGGVSTPIVVTLHNLGIDDLDSAIVHWTVNGKNEQSFKWTGNLLWGSKKQDTVGYYIPTADAYDSLVVWVSMPNGHVDIVTSDDTLSVISYGCGQRISGTQYIGKNRSFTSISEIFTIFNTCHVNGAVTLVLDSGVYDETIDLRNLVTTLGSSPLTITSATSKAEDVVIKPATGQAGIYLGNTHNVTIKDITVDGSTSNTHTVQFMDTCHNIVFRDCRLLNNPTTVSSYNVINKGDNTGIVDSIFFINNLINGGYTAMYFSGGTTTTYGTNVVFDSNTIANQYYYGGRLFYTDFISFSHNTLLSRTTNEHAYYWYALDLNNCNGPIVGNKITQRKANRYPVGITVSNYNNALTSNRGLIANNEIMLKGSDYSGFYGIVVNANTVADIYHNSIYMQGAVNATYGIQVAKSPGTYLAIKNNNIVMEDAVSFPIYLAATDYINQLDINYNNIYAPIYIGYAAGNKSDWTSWRAAVPTDLNSKKIYPDFIDIQQDLTVSNYGDYLCNVISTVNTDINGNPRTGVTTMGCYEDIPMATTNGVLMGLLGFDNAPNIGQVDSLRAIVFNGGNTPITSLNIEWSMGGISYLAGGENFNIPSLAKGESDTVFIGKITHTPGATNVKIWVNSINNGLDIDEVFDDDTLRVSNYVCDVPFSGTLIIADTTDFTTFSRTLELIAQCGVAGDIILALDSGLYQESVNLTDINNFLSGHSLTITSRTGNAKDAVIRPAKGQGILLNKSNNITLKNITVDALVSGTHAIEFAATTCTNVVIRDCELYADPNAASTPGAFPIYRSAAYNASYVLDSIFIVHNLIHGGYAGISMYGGSSYPVALGTNIIIDSNTVSSQNGYGMRLYYADFTSISYNTILSKDTLGSSSWYGISMEQQCIGPIVGNRIIQRDKKITTPYGINLWYYSTNSPGLIANNEIILKQGNSGSYAIRARDNTRANILHNSIYAECSVPGASGIVLGSSSTTFITIKNNNIVMTDTNAYPLYLESGNLSQMDIESNNYYNPAYLGFITGIGAIAAWDDWYSLVPEDMASVSVYPGFSDVNTSLQLSDPTGITCYSLESVPYNIEHQQRKRITSMGCYDAALPYIENAMLSELLPLNQGAAPATTDTIKVVVANTGTTTITEIDFSYAVNNAISTVVKQVNIPVNSMDTITIAGIAYPSKSFDFSIWIDRLNTGNLSDGYRGDDTISTYVVVCSNIMNGDYVIGEGKDFATLNQAFKHVEYCGANGDVNFLLTTGTYSDLIFINLGTQVVPHMLTITSQAKDRDSVIIKAKTAGLKLDKMRNFKFENITIDATAATYGIQFLGACTNIVIHNCAILMDTIKTSDIIGIYKGGSTGVLDSLFITNNFINGGQSGINIQAGTGTGSLNVMGKNIVVDSNVIVNSYRYGFNNSNAVFTSISGNTVKSRSANTQTSWDGFYFNGSNAEIITDNRVLQRSVAITNPYGMNFSSLNRYNTTEKALITNNEIIINIENTSSYSYYSGMCLGAYSKMHVIHNSIYVSGSGIGGKGIYISDNASNSMNIKNNHIAMEANNVYPIHLSAITNLVNYDFDYNNMYSPNYVGYAGTAKSTIEDWQKTVTTDKNSVSIKPQFVNFPFSLELSNFSGLTCPYDTLVPTDIQGILRKNRINTTIMGAYTTFPIALDLGITSVICIENEVQYPGKVPVEIEIANLGTSENVTNAVFGWSVNGVKQTSYTWNPSPAFAPEAIQQIPIGSFEAGKSNMFDIIVWIESVNGGIDSVEWNDTAGISTEVLYTGTNLGLYTIMPLVPAGSLCAPDYAPVKVVVINTGTLDYDFAVNPVSFSIRNTTPVSFSSDTTVSTGVLLLGKADTIELTNQFPILIAGQYDIKVWLASAIENINHDDTLLTDYTADRFGLPVDVNFSNPVLPAVLRSQGVNSPYKWEIVTQGAGADSVVKAQQGTGMLAFSGTTGAMTRLITGQLDLSQTIQPSLAFWYFHDTIPCDDYTDVRITVDGGATYTTLYSITKYDAVYGWRQYSADLPSFAVNQCVILVFEAMEKSRNEIVTQYIDRIRITAKQDIAVADIFTSEFSACDMKNKEWKVVLQNLEDPALIYDNTPIDVVLEIAGTPFRFSRSLQTGSLSGFSSDTIALFPDFDFIPGVYNVKAYFTSVMDDKRSNDTLTKSISIDPRIRVTTHKLSGQDINCLAAETDAFQSITIENIGNMELSTIKLTLQVDTGNAFAPYSIVQDSASGILAPGQSINYDFSNSYIVPWNPNYHVSVTAYTDCNPTIVSNTSAVTECVDMDNLALMSIDKPLSGQIDAVESNIKLEVTLENKSDVTSFSSVAIHARIEDSKGNITANISEVVSGTIGTLDTKPYAFNSSYTVPKDSVYYITVFIEKQDKDNYQKDDTIRTKRITNYNVGIKPIEATKISMSQNFPNPANNYTSITYSIPSDGEVIFTVFSINGQVLYNKSVKSEFGIQTIDINTSHLAAGIYFYSMEFNGQRITKRMSIKR